MIDLTMRPSLLNASFGSGSDQKALLVNGIVQGEISQKEDYGYTVNLGFSELHRFYKCDPTTTNRRNRET